MNCFREDQNLLNEYALQRGCWSDKSEMRTVLYTTDLCSFRNPVSVGRNDISLYVRNVKSSPSDNGRKLQRSDC
ncbi:hypothetical protein M758_11G132400 [Ceratodon purpureus]|nr:hypothetical protein M758_11G132400 [Ceratodon purpureus]